MNTLEDRIVTFKSVADRAAVFAAANDKADVAASVTAIDALT
jgi:hypothetical protein